MFQGVVKIFSKETIQIFKLISLYRIHSPKFLIHATIKPVIYGTIASMFTKLKFVI